MSKVAATQPIVVAPDWSMTGSAAYLEEQLTDFKFDGPGFYLGDGEFLLVVPLDPTPQPWKQRWPKETLFRAHFYGCDFRDSMFGRESLPPVREDHRD